MIKSEVGKLRIKKTMDMMKSTDFALYVMDINNIDSDEYESIKLEFKKVQYTLLISY